MSQPPATLGQMLRQSCQQNPQQPLFLHKDVVVSYEELDRRASDLAGGLRQAGLSRGDRVVLVLNNSVEYLVSYYGVLRAGGVVVPHYPDTRPRMLGHVLDHSRAHALIVERRAGRILGETPTTHLRLAVSVGKPLFEPRPGLTVTRLDELEQAGATPPADDEVGPDDLASIVYTSGTTGRPKGVMLAHQNLLANIESIVAYLELRADDIIGMVLPFFYVYGNSVLHTHIRVGGTIAQLPSLAFPAAVLQGIQTHGCTGFSGVPSTFARLIQFSALNQYDLSSLRTITQAGGPMTPALTQKLRAVVPRARIFVMYGQTEASARLSYLPPEKLDEKIGSAGKAIPGVTLRVVDKAGDELPRGEVGEIVAQGQNIMRGYWRNPEETTRTLRPEGLRTGDLARMDEEGYLFIVGRETDMIKSGAHRIGPQEIEEVVETLPEVAQCAVVGVPDELLGEAIVAFVVPVEGAEVGERQVKRVCHQHLPPFKMPAEVRVVSSLPRTPTGKLRRKELKTWFTAGENGGGDSPD